MKYGLVIAGSLRWFDSAEETAKAWKDNPNAALRVFRNGAVGHGTPDEVKPVYSAMKKA